VGHASRATAQLVALAAAAVLVAPAGAPAGTAVRATPEQVADYWTPERMEAAIPVSGALPAKTAAVETRARRGRLHRRVRNVRRFPKRTHGKVFFRMGGVDYLCSGTAVNAPNRSLVWTAGHCVYEPGLLGAGFATNWQFVPAYKPGGRAPFGEWPAVELEATEQWKDAAPVTGFDFDPTFDLGVATVATGSGGRRLQRVVGARGIAFQRSPRRKYHAFGYPAMRPPAEFTGERMFRCDSRLTGRDSTVGPPSALRIACDMTPGSSGGGWVTKGGKVTSVTSYGYTNQPNSLYGPYMGAVARDLYQGEKR
jgi:hypothetical protein